MKSKETLKTLEISLKKKEEEATKAKSKGMHATYGNLMLEINLLKSKMKKMQMGSK